MEMLCRRVPITIRTDDKSLAYAQDKKDVPNKTTRIDRRTIA